MNCTKGFLTIISFYRVAGPDQASGFGFELTFRLDCDTSMPSSPSTWPAELLQALSRYVFQVTYNCRYYCFNGILL